MNPDQAYRMHTDWARAVQRPGTPTADWFASRMAASCRPLNPGDTSLFRVYSEPQSFPGMLRTGPEPVGTNVVVGWEPRERHADEIPADVFAEPVPEPEPMSVKASAVIVPENVYTKATPHVLASAPTYYVTRDMCTIIEVAAEAFDDFDMMPRLPQSSGFVVLARPIELPMPDGAVQPVRAFAWNTWGDAVTSMGTVGDIGEVWTFASRKDDTAFDMVADAAEQWPSKKAWQTDPDLLPCYADWVFTGTPIGPTSESVAYAEARRRAFDWFHQQSVRFEKRDAEGTLILPTVDEWSAMITAAQAREDQYLAAATQKDRIDQYGRFQPYLAAFVMLLTQQITLAEPEHPTSDAVRLAKQVGDRRPDSVTVVDIRHSARPHRDDTDDAGEGTGHKRGPLTHRHLVGSHWKWQPYGKDRALRRRIFVAGYVRGPEDKPLVVKPRVTRL